MAKSSLHIQGSINLRPGTAPADPAEGDLYYDDATDVLQIYTGSGFDQIAGVVDQEIDLLWNVAIATSVAANALTIALKTNVAADPSAGDPVKVAFRNATSATGTRSLVNITSAVSTVISSGSTGGTTSAVLEYIYVYLLNNSGTAELAWAYDKFDDGSIVSTTAEGGAGGADSSALIYSTTARSNVAIRLIARLSSTQATAGTWATPISEVALVSPNVQFPYKSEIVIYGGNGHGSTNTKIRRFATVQRNVGRDMTLTQSATNGDSITINTPGIYHFDYGDSATVSVSGNNQGLTVNSAELTTNFGLQTVPATVLAGTQGSDSANLSQHVSVSRYFISGDVIRPHTAGNLDSVSNWVKLTAKRIG